MEADFLINVPTMKTHVATGVSLCMKNLKGVLPENEEEAVPFFGRQQICHRPQLHRQAPPLRHRRDRRDGRGRADAGQPVHLGVILAGTDPVATDIIATRVMGLDPWKFKCFNYARQQDLGVWREADITLTGVPLDASGGPSARLRTFSRCPGHYPVDGGACPGCLDGARIALGRIRTGRSPG